jgi:prepilin-type N-terminal cleavage/methylation domain-containing protein
MAPAPRNGRRAYTLLEVLIALVLLVCIASLALPSMLGMGERMSFDQSCEQVRAWTLLARAEAQVRGELLELAESHAGTGPSVLMLRRASDRDDPSEPGAQAWRRVLGELGPGLRASRTRPVREELPTTPAEDAQREDTPRDERLLLIRPDGTVDDGGGFYIWNADWRCVRATARSLTGVLDVVPVELTTEQTPRTTDGAGEGSGSGEAPGEG